MNEIRIEILNHLQNENIYDINLDTLFHLYDSILFNHQISEKRSIYLQEENTYFNYGNITSNLNIIKSQWVISRIENASSASMLNIFGTDNKLKAYLIWVEYQILIIMIIIWGYSSIISDKLIKCCSDKFFDYTTGSVLKNLTNPKLTYYPKGGLKGYSYWENSCNIDSLSMILLYSDAYTFKRLIFETDVFNINYKNDVARLVCDSRSKIKTVLDWRKFVSKLQSIYIDDYTNMFSINEYKCYNLRNQFS